MNVSPESGSEASSGGAWHSFTCPVCGHRDRAEVEAAGVRTTCSHCETQLVLGSAGPDQERVTASVYRAPDSEGRPH